MSESSSMTSMFLSLYCDNEGIVSSASENCSPLDEASVTGTECDRENLSETTRDSRSRTVTDKRDVLKKRDKTK